MSSTCILSLFLHLLSHYLQPDPWKCFRHAACLKTSVSNLLALPAEVIKSCDAAAGAQCFFTTLGHSISIENFSTYILFYCEQGPSKKREAKSLGLKGWPPLKCHPRALTVALHTPPKAGISFTHTALFKKKKHQVLPPVIRQGQHNIIESALIFKSDSTW